MNHGIKYVLYFCILMIASTFASAQRVNLKGTLLMPESKTILFERLKSENSWKIWKGSDYRTEVDSSGTFSISLPVNANGHWKITHGTKRAKLLLNANQHVLIELDSNLAIKKIMRQDLIDSPLRSTF